MARLPVGVLPGLWLVRAAAAALLYLDANPELVMGDVLQVGPERSISERFRARARSSVATLREQAQLRTKSLRRDLAVRGTGGDAVVAEDENVTARHERGA
jgi:hypothetical protein